MLIFLVGFMGCGKSTVGRRVAQKLGYSFIDMDSRIEEGAGKKIGEIFREQGEDAFRRMESEFIQSLRAGGDTVVATGGGAPCFGDNMDRMLEKGYVVYFNMKPETLAGRLAPGRHKRPKLAGMDDREMLRYIERTLAEREKFYNRSSVSIDCNGVSDEYIASHIASYVEFAAGRGL